MVEGGYKIELDQKKIPVVSIDEDDIIFAITDGYSSLA